MGFWLQYWIFRRKRARLRMTFTQDIKNVATFFFSNYKFNNYLLISKLAWVFLDHVNSTSSTWLTNVNITRSYHQIFLRLTLAMWRRINKRNQPLINNTVSRKFLRLSSHQDTRNRNIFQNWVVLVTTLFSYTVQISVL